MKQSLRKTVVFKNFKQAKFDLLDSDITESFR